MSRIRILVVVNPVAGKGKAMVVKQQIYHALQDRFELDYLIWEDATLNVTRLVVEQLNARKYMYVLVVGGDGTVNQVSKALINRSETLVIIPVGSGNGLARHLNIPMKTQKAIELLNYGKPISIDVIKLPDGYSFCTTGIGYDAHVAHLFARAGKRGWFSYVRMVLRSFLTYEPQQYILTSDTFSLNLKAFFITIANANQWGNNVKVAPNAVIDDGFLNIVVLKPFKWFHLPDLVFKLLLGNFFKSKCVTNFICKRIEIQASQKQVEGHFDGEPVMFSSSVVFECIPKTVNVLVPAK